MKTLLIALALCFASASSLMAELTLPHFFSDHMVLQRERPAAIWGKAAPNADIKVSFKGETVTTKSDANGAWKIEIATGMADATGAELTIQANDEKRVIRDVLVGEVWFASGQSNMFFPMNRVKAYEEMISKTNLPAIRTFSAPLVTATEPQDDIEGEWTAASPETIPGYSAVAFFFTKHLHEELEIPIGMIKSAWGGKPVETFTSRAALNTHPGTKKMVDALLQADAGYDQTKAQAAYETRLDQWEAALAEAKKLPAAERKKLPKKPQPPKRPLDTEGRPGVLFDSMIYPFAGYTMRGAIWYQGEGNAKPGAVPYDETLPLMINDWRERWDDDFSFYYAQLANYKPVATEPGNNDPWPLLQDRMRLVLDTTPKTGMAIINDIGDAKDIHPKNKHDVGKRLALWALAKDYGQDITYSGPLYQSSNNVKGAIEVTFDQVGSGLRVRDGKELQRFEIAGEDKVWHWATAKITNEDTVIVMNSKVEFPVAVRYAWAANPEGANLVNSEGLPASVFRTDDWDDVEEKIDPAVAKAAEVRRALAVEIKALGARLKALEPKAEEARELLKKRQEMLKEFKATAPAAK
ncbi:MAG: hypothetical protein P1U86_16300 [Verrucomicrobiales bacterium]|nr:hypothetical protein [Verrucomicrobiales bacterium]